MKKICVLGVFGLSCLLLLGYFSSIQAAPLGTGFTYQGRLSEGGQPANGDYDFRFRLYDTDTGGNQVGTTQTLTNQPVANGLFVISSLDFGSGVFNGEGRWLEMDVRQVNPSGTFTTLTPRQYLAAAPYAVYALNSPGGTGVGDITAVNAGTGLSGGGTAGDVTLSADTAYLQRRVSSSCTAGSSIRVINADGTVTCQTDTGTTYTAGTGLSLSGTQFSLLSGYQLPQSCTNGQIPKFNGSTWACGPDNDSTSFWGLAGSAGTNPTTNYLGTSDNQALALRVNGQRVLRLEPITTATHGFAPNLLGGYGGNTITAGVSGVTIAGGGKSGWLNSVTDDFGTIGGGLNNQAGDNTGDFLSAPAATVGGGSGNKATGDAATVSGGWGNTASSVQATVGGGVGNTASGTYATVPGGSGNTATGNYSLAAGAQASATQIGSFVWSSSEATASWGNFTFTARAPGGARFYSASGTGTGVQLSSGGTSWGSISDRNVKDNFSVVDSQWLLETLAAMPIQTWNLKSQASEMRHVGPVAQDFNGRLSPLFGTVEDPLRINNMDAVGVALAAIQGLYQVVKEKDERITILENQNATLVQGISSLKEQVESLRASMKLLEQALNSNRSPLAHLDREKENGGLR